MLTKLQRTLIFHIRNNITYYILILCGFVCGGIIAAVCVFGLSELDFKELTVYFNDFFTGMNRTGADSFEVFRLSVFANLKLYTVVMLLSMMVIGSLFVPLISAAVGYSFCFTLFYMFKAYALKGALFFVAGMLPHQLINFPCCLLMLIVSMQFSASLLKDKGDSRTKISGYILKMVILFLVSVPASLLQGYIEPVFIRLIAPVFLDF